MVLLSAPYDVPPRQDPWHQLTLPTPAFNAPSCAGEVSSLANDIQVDAATTITTEREEAMPINVMLTASVVVKLQRQATMCALPLPGRAMEACMMGI